MTTSTISRWSAPLQITSAARRPLAGLFIELTRKFWWSRTSKIEKKEVGTSNNWKIDALGGNHEDKCKGYSNDHDDSNDFWPSALRCGASRRTHIYAGMDG